MYRYLLIALVLVAPACSKRKGGAPATSSGDKSPPTAEPPTPTTTTPTLPEPPAAPPQPIVGEGGGSEHTRDQALQAGRDQAIIGPSADTDAFKNLDEQPPSPKQKRKGEVATTEQPRSSGGTVAVKTPTLDHRALVGTAKLVDGASAPAALVRALKVKQAEVQACYAKSLAKQPDLVGALTLSFTVMPSGSLSAASIDSSTVKQMELETCVVSVVQKIKLSPPLGTTETKATVAITFAKK